MVNINVFNGSFLFRSQYVKKAKNNVKKDDLTESSVLHFVFTTLPKKMDKVKEYIRTKMQVVL